MSEKTLLEEKSKERLKNIQNGKENQIKPWGKHFGMNNWIPFLGQSELGMNLMNALENRDLLEHKFKGVLKKLIDATKLSS
jgi:hypothetical protein